VLWLLSGGFRVGAEGVGVGAEGVGGCWVVVTWLGESPPPSQGVHHGWGKWGWGFGSFIVPGAVMDDWCSRADAPPSAWDSA
jgi:hypothetical protein